MLALALVLLSRNFTARFVGHHEWNSADFAMFARNHIEYGLGYTKFFCTFGNTREPPAQPHRYLNHPPLLALLVAAPMVVFGDHEWVARLVPIAATLGSVWLIMLMLRDAGYAKLGLLAGICYAILPAVAYFGRMVCHEAPCQFFSLLLLHGYLHWSGLYVAPSRPAGIVCYCVGAVAGIATGWIVVLMAGLILAVELARVVQGRGTWSRWLAMAAVPATTLTLVFLHILAGSAGQGGFLLPLLQSRIAGRPDETLSTFAEWISTLYSMALTNFTPLGLIAMVLAILALPFGKRLVRRLPGDEPASVAALGCIVLLPLTQGILWTVVFRHQSAIHDYWQFYLSPFCATSLATVILLVHQLLARFHISLARASVLILLAGLAISSAQKLDAFHSIAQISPDLVELLAQIGEKCPPHEPILSSFDNDNKEMVGELEVSYPHPQIEYYAHRPLLAERDYDQIVANRHQCKFYLMELNDQESVNLTKRLIARYPYIRAGQSYLLFDLQHPIQSPAAAAAR